MIEAPIEPNVYLYPTYIYFPHKRTHICLSFIYTVCLASHKLPSLFLAYFLSYPGFQDESRWSDVVGDEWREWVVVWNWLKSEVGKKFKKSCISSMCLKRRSTKKKKKKLMKIGWKEKKKEKNRLNIKKEKKSAWVLC